MNPKKEIAKVKNSFIEDQLMENKIYDAYISL